MALISISTLINAPLDLVFDTVADINNFSKAIPHIKNVEFLSEIREGVGTKFRETREMRGREMSNELEVTEYRKNKQVRIVTDSQGTVWDTLFTTNEKDGVTTLTLAMEARPHTLMSRLTLPLTKGMITKAIEGDMRAVKEYCESQES